MQLKITAPFLSCYCKIVMLKYIQQILAGFMKQIPPGLTKAAEELDMAGITFQGLREDRRTFFALLGRGVFWPNAAAFAYDGMGVLIHTPYPPEQSKLTNKFKQELPDKVKVLAYNRPTLFYDGNGKPVIYADDVNSSNVPFLVPFLYPGETEEVGLDAIVFLSVDERHIHTSENPWRGAIGYFITSHGHTPTEKAEKTLEKALSGVKFWGIGTNPDLSYPRILNKVFAELKDALDGLRTGTYRP